MANLSSMEGQAGRAALVEALIANFQEREIPRVTPRNLSLPSLPGKADVVVGMRRSGKTWFLYQRLGELLAQGVDRSRLLYLNFEDERLLPLETSDRSGYEVDFLAENSRGARELIQVCASLEAPSTRQREIRALEEGMKETGCE